MATLFGRSVELTSKTVNNVTPVALFDEVADPPLLVARNAGSDFVCFRVVCTTGGMTIVLGGSDISTTRGTLLATTGQSVEIPTSEVPYAMIYAGGASAEVRVTAIT